MKNSGFADWLKRLFEPPNDPRKRTQDVDPGVPGDGGSSDDCHGHHGDHGPHASDGGHHSCSSGHSCGGGHGCGGSH